MPDTTTGADMTASSAELAELGAIFADAKAYADPVAWHAAARRLRHEAPILRVELPNYPGYWAITRHADVMEIERNPDIFTNAPTPVLVDNKGLHVVESRGPILKTLIEMDGDEHKANRAVVNDWFKPGSVRRLQDRVDELAKRYVDQMEAFGGECDFARDVAMHYPLQVILTILGLPESDFPRMLRLTQELFGAEDPDIARLGSDSSMAAVVLDFVTYFSGLAAARREHPTDDLASVIANAELDGVPLRDLDVFGLYLLMATAGHDTTSNSIAGGLLALIEHPDQLALLQAQPELIDHAADELIRYVSPVKHFMRTAQEPYDLHGITIQPGEHVLLSFASANRDETVFADPFRLDVQRENASQHLAFGFGRHFCLGAHLARMEVRSIFRELLGRLESVELAGDPTFVQATLVSGPKSLPLTYTWH